MTTPNPSAEFLVQPDQFTPAALAPLVDHPDVLGATANEHDIPTILPAIVMLGQTAIVRGDTEAYQAWVGRAVTFVDEVQVRPMDAYERTQFYGHVSQLYFFGAMHGEPEAVERLHEILDGPMRDETLDAFLRLSAEHGLNPVTWIERHASDPDERAAAWGQYMSTRRLRAERLGQELTPAELAEPGTDRFLNDVIAGRISADTMLSWGISAYRLADDPFVKRQIISRFGLAVHEVASSDEGTGRRYYAMMAFATTVNGDSSIPHELKEDLSQQIAVEVPDWSDAGGREPRANFEMSVAIEAGEDVPAMLERIERVAMLDDHPYRRSELRDTLMSSASQLYARLGQFERAAAMMARVTSTFQWHYAANRYASLGGDMSLAQQADDMRQIFDDAPASESPIYGQTEWESRRLILSFLAQTSPANPDFEAARETLLEMSAALARGTLFYGYAERLLAVDPASVVIGPRLIERLQQADSHMYLQSIYELFARNGSAELAQAGWAAIQARPHSRSTYLSHYARLAVASVTLPR